MAALKGLHLDGRKNLAKALGSLRGRTKASAQVSDFYLLSSDWRQSARKDAAALEFRERLVDIIPSCRKRETAGSVWLGSRRPD